MLYLQISVTIDLPKARRPKDKRNVTDIDRDITTLTDIDAIISATPRPGLQDRVRSFGSRFVRVKQVLSGFSFGSRAVIITFIHSLILPYTWNFSRHVYFTVNHETRIFADEGYPKFFAFFAPCYKAMYKKCMLLI